MILLAMMFILGSRCQAAACAARGPAPHVLSRETFIKSKITVPVKCMSVCTKKHSI